MNTIEISNRAKALIENAGIKCDNVVMSSERILVRPAAGFLEMALAFFASQEGKFASVEKKYNSVAEADVIIATFAK